MIIRVIDGKLGPDYAWPGNVRELEQCARRIILSRDYDGETAAPEALDLLDRLQQGMANGEINAQHLLAGYCALLYRRHGTFEEVARRTNLDRRTVKKYITEWTDDSDQKSA